MFRNFQIDHPGTDSDGTIEKIDLMDLTETKHFEDHAFFFGNCATGQTRTGSSRQEADTIAVQQLDDGHQFLPVSGKTTPIGIPEYRVSASDL